MPCSKQTNNEITSGRSSDETNQSKRHSLVQN